MVVGINPTAQHDVCSFTVHDSSAYIGHHRLRTTHRVMALVRWANGDKRLADRLPKVGLLTLLPLELTGYTGQRVTNHVLPI